MKKEDDVRLGRNFPLREKMYISLEILDGSQEGSSVDGHAFGHACTACLNLFRDLTQEIQAGEK